MRTLSFTDVGFVAGGFTVSLPEFAAYGSYANLGAGTLAILNFAASTGFCIGSVAPYTFSWGAVAGSPTITCSPTNTSGTSFRWDGTVGAGGYYFTTFRCTGVSAAGRTGVSSPMEIFIEVYPGDPP
jgi:hypothetical protein